MIDIYVNEATGKKIKVYKQTMVHVYDHDYEEIEKAYDNEEWEKVIELSGCRYCKYDIDFDWVVEEVA